MTSPELADVMMSLGYDCAISRDLDGRAYEMGFRKAGERRWTRIPLPYPLPTTRDGVLFMLLRKPVRA